LVKIKRDIENQICGLLKNLGLLIGKNRGKAFTSRVEELIALFWRPLLGHCWLPARLCGARLSRSTVTS
jgi:hypothetical protein